MDMITTDTPTDRQHATGPRAELASYTTDTGERRVLIGQRLDGIPRLTDEPAEGDGRRYLVEPHLHTNDELEAIVADYLAKAAELGYPPMHGWY